MRASNEVRITAETITSRLNHQAHDEGHAHIADMVKPRRSTAVRSVLNGLGVKSTTITGTGILVTFVDGTRGYFSRSSLPSDKDYV